METTIPVLEHAYAAWSSPTNQAQADGQPEPDASKWPNAYAAECRPSLAIARTQTIIDTKPANVQKIANV